MDILFVEPFGSGQIRLGITTLAAVLKQNGFSVEIVDLLPGKDVPYKRSEEYFQKCLKQYPKVIAFTATTPTFHKTVEAVKKVRPYCNKIITGGPHSTIFRERILEKVPEVDVVVMGEAEETITQIMEALISEKSLQDIKGIAYRNGDKICVNPPAPLTTDLDKIPFPARELLDIDAYDAPFNVMSSRGCPYNCVYCSKPVTNTNWRSRSPKNVVDEIEQAFEKYPHVAKRINRTVGISDDNFTINKERAIGICDELISRHMDINMTCATGIHVNTISSELLQKMKDAGCSELWYGMETGNPKLLQAIGKATSIEQIKKAVELSKKIGIQGVGGHFIIGLPNETLKEARETIAFMKNLKLDIAGINHMVPFPSTAMWGYVKEHGTLLATYEDVVDYRNFLSYGKENPIFETPEFPAEERRIAYNEAAEVIDSMIRNSIMSTSNIKKFMAKVRSPKDIIWGIKRVAQIYTKTDLRRVATIAKPKHTDEVKTDEKHQPTDSN
ncbi:MAG: radical SAM protein [archaeon]|jgi:radical SAM superfamily enzyme YgiQ (UPF0313 family)